MSATRFKFQTHVGQGITNLARILNPAGTIAKPEEIGELTYEVHAQRQGIIVPATPLTVGNVISDPPISADEDPRWRKACNADPDKPRNFEHAVDDSVFSARDWYVITYTFTWTPQTTESKTIFEGPAR